MEQTPDFPDLKLRPREDRRLKAGHLWVYSNEIDTRATPLKPLEAVAIVRLVSDRNRFLGYAGINPHGLIAARILSRDPVRPPGRSLVRRRLRVALAMRERLYPGGYYRLIFGESDGLPGLIADRFGDYVVLQSATATMETMKGHVVDAVTRELEPKGILWRNDSGARDMESLPRYVEVATGDVPDMVPVVEGEQEFLAPLHEGQKTGWFYDQRDNRARFERYPADSILDVFCYTGAWGLGAARRGVRASFVDSSAQALGWIEKEASREDLPVETLQGNAFDVLRTLRDEGRRFDAVIVDPPAFIKRKKDFRRGLAAYQRINQLAMLLLGKDGWLVSCSCSHHLAEADLVAALQRAARHVGRFMQVLEIGGQSADHPVHPAIPETRYLKAVFCRLAVDG